MDHISKHLIISGRVQGVGFRYFTYRTAKEHQLKGWVKNLYDGTVEVVVTGSRKKVAKMIEKLKEGPPSARVQDIEEIDKPPNTGQLEDFSIRR